MGIYDPIAIRSVRGANRLESALKKFSGLRSIALREKRDFAAFRAAYLANGSLLRDWTRVRRRIDPSSTQIPNLIALSRTVANESRVRSLEIRADYRLLKRVGIYTYVYYGGDPPVRLKEGGQACRTGG